MPLLDYCKKVVGKNLLNKNSDDTFKILLMTKDKWNENSKQ